MFTNCPLVSVCLHHAYKANNNKSALVFDIANKTLYEAIEHHVTQLPVILFVARRLQSLIDKRLREEGLAMRASMRYERTPQNLTHDEIKTVNTPSNKHFSKCNNIYTVYKIYKLTYSVIP